MSSSVSRISLFFASIFNRIAAWFVASPDDDPTPPASPAMLALPAPRIAGLLPAPSAEAIRIDKARRLAGIHERNIERRAYMRRRRVMLRMEGRDYPTARWAIALPASVGEIVKTGYQEVTATIAMQGQIEELAGVKTGNPNDAWQALMDAYLQKQAAKQDGAAAGYDELREAQYRKTAAITRIGGRIAA